MTTVKLYVHRTKGFICTLHMTHPCIHEVDYAFNYGTDETIARYPECWELIDEWVEEE